MHRFASEGKEHIYSKYTHTMQAKEQDFCKMANRMFYRKEWENDEEKKNVTYERCVAHINMLIIWRREKKREKKRGKMSNKLCSAPSDTFHPCIHVMEMIRLAS